MMPRRAVRRREPDGAARAALIEATRAEMIEAGSADVSLHAIARRAGVTTPLLTYHFGTKEALFLELAGLDMLPPIRQLDRLVGSDLPPDEKLRLHIGGIIRNYARKPYLNSLLNLLLRDESSETSKSIAQEMVEPLTAALRQILDEGAKSGVFRVVDPAMTYLMIVGACQYAFSTKLSVTSVMPNRDAVATEAYVAATVEMFLRGLRPETSETRHVVRLAASIPVVAPKHF